MRPLRIAAAAAVAVLLVATAASAQDFQRGDANCDGMVTLADLDTLAAAPFSGPACSGTDVNEDGAISVADLVALMRIATCAGTRVPPPPPSAPCPPAPGMFTDCFATSGLRLGSFPGGENGAAVADVDGDGFPDVFFWNTAGGAGLFRNLGDRMQFASVADSPLRWPETIAVMAAAFADLDNDGRPDLVVALDETADVVHCPLRPTTPVSSFHVYRNLGDFRFVEVTVDWGFGEVPVHSEDKPQRVNLALFDINLDGRLDVVEFARGRELRPLIFLSRGSGSWEEAGEDVFGDTRGLTFTWLFSDINHDQLPDLFVINDYDFEFAAKYFQRVDRSLRYDDVSFPPIFGDQPFGSPMGAATADLDGDGDLELVVSDTGDQHVFSRGQSVGAAWNVSQSPSRWGLPQNCWSVAVIDLENDGLPDLFFACAGFRIGLPDRATSFFLRNIGGRFELVAGLLPGEDSPTWDEGLAIADFDQDGRVDLLTGGEEQAPRLLWNQVPGGGSLALRLDGTTANAQGIGARIEVRGHGLPLQVREMFPGGTTWGYGDAQAFFGLGAAERATVTVDWRPAGGMAVQTTELPAGSWVIQEP